MSPGAFAWRAIINEAAKLARTRSYSLALARQIILIHHQQRLARAFNVISMARGQPGIRAASRINSNRSRSLI